MACKGFVGGDSMAGFINSPTQVAILEFLERVGPCPYQPLEILFGKKTARHLWVLRQARYIYNLTLSDIAFWIPQDYGRFNPKRQELLAWFVARWEQGGGKYQNGVAVSPDETELIMQIERDKITLTSDKQRFYVLLSDLQEKEIKHCIKTQTENNTKTGNNQGNDNQEAKDLFARIVEIRQTLKTEPDPKRISELTNELQELKDLRKKLILNKV